MSANICKSKVEKSCFPQISIIHKTLNIFYKFNVVNTKRNPFHHNAQHMVKGKLTIV